MEEIKVIRDFLENWKEDARKFYTEARNYYEEINANKNELFPTQYYKSPSGRECSISSSLQVRQHFAYKYNKSTLVMVTDKWYDLDKEIEKEAERKYKKLISTVEKKSGKIIDARGLKIGNNLDLNGTIVGEDATVRVETISAGGYNVQCFHYRIKVTVI